MITIKKCGSLLLAASLIGAGLAGCSEADSSSHAAKKADEKTVQEHKAKNTGEKKTASQTKPKAINWNAPSGGAYPTLKKGENIWLDVSVGQQKVYVKDGNKTIYTMIASTGLDTTSDNSTPKGTYHIQAERGTWFYTPKYKEGAEYWVSWKNHGEFLFHSVPMDKNRHVIAADAEKLGQKDSHGCVHLTVSDAKWIYDNIPYNTKVVIRS